MADKLGRIHRELEKSYKKAKRVQVKIDEAKWIIFSDHHRGSRDGADDFLICEKTYLKALEHYNNNDFNLCLLGDVEEFWENSPLVVMTKYANVLQAEKAFFDKDRLHRIWGNHDDDWRIAGQISKHLGWMFPKIKVNESIVMELTMNNKCREVLLVHGHQGTLNSDRLAWLSRLFVRFIWRNIQRLFKVALSTPANNTKLKSEHDRAMYQWADYNDKVIICGHTHHPVFMSYTHADKLKHELREMETKFEKSPSPENDQALTDLRQKLFEIQMDEGDSLQIFNPKPFYFNSGCCSFSDGDITGLEIADGHIRLVKWTADCHEPMILGTTELSYLLEYC
ncbi:MAG: hypothetical protein HKN45_00175 [Flavobacteriales bacterium]|nr:hypothetical protein [Flavobacteriales bacterium]NNK80117.1 hypothetical protein [Flavobacteriales bacterium]